MSSERITSCQALEQYLNYLTVIKGRSDNTINEYQNDLLNMFRFIRETRINDKAEDSSYYDIDFIKSIAIHDMYSFIAFSQK